MNIPPKNPFVIGVPPEKPESKKLIIKKLNRFLQIDADFILLKDLQDTSVLFYTQGEEDKGTLKYCCDVTSRCKYSFTTEEELLEFTTAVASALDTLEDK
jgi:hypothetical protein